MLIGAGDVLVAGHHGIKTVAAIGIANGISSPIFLIGIGLLLGISPLLSKKRGESKDVASYFYTSIIYAIIIGVAFMLLTIFSIPIIKYLGFDKELIPLIKDYLFIVSFSYVGSYIFLAIKEYLQATENVVFANVISVIAVFTHVALDYVLVFGIFIFPELGVRGLAYATIITRFAMALILFIYSKRHNRTKFSFISDFAKRVFKFSLPISLSFFIEVLAFSVIMVMIGRIGSLYAAVHNIALTIGSTTYMVPLSISSAAAVKISYFYGKKDFKKMKEFIKAALILSTVFMTFSSLCLYLFPETVLGIFTSDRQVIVVGTSVIIVCAISQIFDGAQVTLAGVLRGLGITKPTFIVVVIGYWLIGIPFGYYFGYVLKLNALGFWIGLTLSLIAIAAFLFTYLVIVIKRIKLFDV